MLCVPASRRSGSSSGICASDDRLPVPPYRNGSVTSSASAISSPVPCGPYNPLCPGIHTAAALGSFRQDISQIPADCEASTINGTPYCDRMPSISPSGRQ